MSILRVFWIIIVIFTAIENMIPKALSGGLLQSQTNIDCEGDVDETKWYSRTYTDNGVTKHVGYADEIHTTLGHLKLSDSFQSDSRTDNESMDNSSNLIASNDIEFNQDNNSYGFIRKIQRVDLSVYDCSGNSFYDIAAGDSIDTSSVKSQTSVSVQAGDKPSLDYHIDSGGDERNFGDTMSSLKTGIEVTMAEEGQDEENYHEHYSVSGHFKLSKSIKFAK
jgi:hypothetical protein